MLRPVEKVFPLKEKPKARTLLGRVIRTESPRTCVVQVEKAELHPDVRKVYQHKHWIHVHDPDQKCYVGDEVVIKPRKTSLGLEFQGKPYEVARFLSKSDGYTDHNTGTVHTRTSVSDTSYRIPEGRPAYMKHILFADNLVVAKGKRAVLEKTAHGVRGKED
eukprot:sb/3472743/